MVAFTGLAKTTANLEQSQKVGLEMFYNPFAVKQVEVNVLQNINITKVGVIATSNTIVSSNFSKNLKIYNPIKDVGWCKFQNYTNIIKKSDILKNSNQVGAAKYRKLYFVQKYS